jgi:hypothetical protein
MPIAQTAITTVGSSEIRLTNDERPMTNGWGWLRQTTGLALSESRLVAIILAIPHAPSV